MVIELCLRAMQPESHTHDIVTQQRKKVLFFFNLEENIFSCKTLLITKRKKKKKTLHLLKGQQLSSWKGETTSQQLLRSAMKRRGRRA